MVYNTAEDLKAKFKTSLVEILLIEIDKTYI
jgi:hypothetical protein